MKNSNMRCRNCLFFFGPNGQNQCRKKPPVRGKYTNGDFPLVQTDWYCGEWFPDETASPEVGELLQQLRTVIPSFNDNLDDIHAEYDFGTQQDEYLPLR